MLIPGYKEGSNISLIDVSYIKPRKDENGKKLKDYIDIVYKDNNTNEKKNYIIYEPEYTYYRLNDDLHIKSNRFFIDKNKLKPVTCKYSEILKSIASVTGNLDWFYDNIRNGNFRENNKLHKIKEIFRSDMDIENYYRMEFNKQYKNDTINITKGFLDIEVDGINAMSDFPKIGECPINAIAFIDWNGKRCYQYLLRNSKNPLISKYESWIKTSEAIEELKQFIVSSVGGYKKAVRMGIIDLDYDIQFFNDEAELIVSTFDKIYEFNPDFMLVWNMIGFDIAYIYERCKVIGLDPLDVLGNVNAKEKYCKLYLDERNRNEYSERCDYAKISCNTVWLDQMIQFASRRKGRGQYPRFKLDAIGETVAGVRKLDYSHITTEIAKLPYLDYKVFSWYNIMDTIVQACIESKTQDVNYIYTKCLVNNTKYSKGHRQSVYMANRFAKDFDTYGYILGNNVNRWNSKPDTKFPGALVGNPLHNSVYSLVYINGRPTLIVSNAIDFDYKSLYPSIILENNIAPNTQLGLFIIPVQVHDKEHHDMYSSDDEIARYSRAGEFFDNLMSGNDLEFCKRWFHLGGIKDVINDMKEYFTVNTPSVPLDYNPLKPYLMYKTNTNKIELFKESNGYTQDVNLIYFVYERDRSKDEEFKIELKKDGQLIV